MQEYWVNVYEDRDGFRYTAFPATSLYSVEQASFNLRKFYKTIYRIHVKMKPVVEYTTGREIDERMKNGIAKFNKEARTILNQIKIN
jgi:hypothetical protein